jgi:hypothetical protein
MKALASCWLGGILVAADGALAADDAIRMLFRDKPPYSYIEAGVEKGFLLERTRAILSSAGVSARFEQMPPKRLFAEIEANQSAACSFGWYKIPAREVFARFSLPIHQDRPHAVLANKAAAPRLATLGSLQEIARRPEFSLAVADGVSYGPELDALIKGFAGRVDRAVIPPLQVAQKVAAGRADFMFIDQDDLDYLKETDRAFDALGLASVPLRDAPAGLKRYILCNHQVPQEILARIDAAIRNTAAGGK